MAFLQEIKKIVAQWVTRLSLLDYVVIYIAILYSAVFSLVSIYRYQNFMSYLDLGTHVQAIHTTLSEGRLLYQNFEALNTVVREGYAYYGSYLGIHFAPILFSVVPIFAVFPRPETLLALKSIAIGLSVIPAYCLAKTVLPKKTTLLVTVLYVLHPALHTLTFSDFQAQAFFPLLILAAIFFLKKENYPFYYLTLILSLMTMEFMSILVAAYVLIEIVVGKNKHKAPRIHLMVTLLVAVVWFVIANLIMSTFKPQALSPWTSVLEGGALQAISYGFVEKIVFLLIIFVPFGFLPIQSPYVLSLLPWIGITLTSTSGGGFQLGWHYGAYFMPFLYIALLDAISNGGNKIGMQKINVNPKLGRTLLVVSIILSIAFTPLNPVTNGNLPGIAYTAKPFDSKHVELLNNITKLIPPNAIVLAQTPLSQHLATRSNTYTYVPNLDDFDIEYIIADSKHWDFKFNNFDKTIKSALNSAKYGILTYSDGILLLKRGYNGDPLHYKNFVGIFGYSGIIASKLFTLSGTLAMENSRIVYDPSSKSGYVIMYDATTGWGGTSWYGPGIWLLPGSYNVTFALKVDPHGEVRPEGYFLTLDVSTRSGQIFAKRHVYGVSIPATRRWFNITLPFALDKIVEDVEFRGLNVNGASIYLDYIFLEQTSQSYAPITSFTFDYEDLGISKAEVVDKVIVHTEGNGTMWLGPLKTLQPTNYTARFWLRLDNTTEGHLIDIEATAKGTEKLAYLGIYGNNFTEVGSWQVFELTFTLSSEANVEFAGLNVEEDAQISLLIAELQGGTP